MRNPFLLRTLVLWLFTFAGVVVLLPAHARPHWIGYGFHRAAHPFLLAADPPTDIPVIARLAGFRIGADTIEAMERRLGPGHKYTGQHPHGGRAWRERRTRWQINADGFDYSHAGRVLNSLGLGADASPITGSVFDTPMPTPRVLVRRHSLGWMGVVFPGMTPRQVLLAVKGKLPPPRVKGKVWQWHEKGFIRVNTINDEKYSDWNAAVSFDGGRVSDISLECE